MKAHPLLAACVLLAGNAMLLTAAGACARTEPAQSAPAAESVVLLHGLGRSERAMRPLAAHLARSGFEVHNLDYPSTEKTPEELVASLDEQIAACCARARVLHFVGHSLGGILIRAYLAEHAPPNTGRVVLLAPPNRGSEIVDAVGDSALFAWLLGPTAEQLGTDADSLPNRLPPPATPVEVGVIAGTSTVNPLGSVMLPDEDDGAVTVASTRLEGMSDFIEMPVSHTFIMRSDEVAEQVAHFLRHGRFAREDDAGRETR